MIYVLSDEKVKNALNLAVIKIEFLKPDLNLNEFEVIIFTSKNGVLALDNLTKEWKNIPAFVVGEASAKKVKELGGNLAYVSSSFYGDNLAMEILALLKNKKVLYISAKKVISNLVSILKENKIDLTQKILYETKCSDCKNLTPPEKNSYIIFSSPSTIKCFFECFEWDYSYKAVAIGKSSAKFIPKEIDFMVSPVQTLSGCVEFILSLR